MALPVIRSISDCVDLGKTVSPYIPQLYDLPQQVLQTISNPQGLVSLYTSTNPLIAGFALSLFLAPVFLVVSEINKNYSQVDRCWSILPTVYNTHYALYAHLTGLPSGRLDALLGASVLWSVRKNFWLFEPLLTLIVPADLQLLAERWLSSRCRRLQVGNPAETYSRAALVSVQRLFHLAGPERKCLAV